MSALILLLATFIWGTAFLAQKFGSESLGPFAMTCFRNLLGGAFLLAVVSVRGWRSREDAFAALRAGVFCGVPLFLAMVAQQIGIAHTTPGVSAFLTTNYMFIIPVFCLILYRKLPPWPVAVGVVAALAGTYLICMANERMSVGPGEFWTLLCAFFFAVQMMVVDRYAKSCDVLTMSMTQLFTCAVLAVPFLFIGSESARLSFATLFAPRTGLSVVYLGVFSSGIAYTLQNFAQARTSPAVAGVVLSTESVFGALSGYVVLGDRMTVGQFVGCALVFGAALIASARRT